MSMPGVNGYRDDYNKYYDSRSRSVDDYGRREDYRREAEPYDTRMDPPPQRERYVERHSPQDYRDSTDVYSKVNRGRDSYDQGHHHNNTNSLEGYRPYKIEKDEYPMLTFDLDHLATFSVSTTQGLVSPQDGIKKLRHMEMQTGIWTMRVQMLLEPMDIVIIDRQSGEEMERFPLPLVTQPTAVTNSDRKDVYNNIILFTVQEDTQKGSPSEMHIFQVLGKAAQLVVDEVKRSRADVQRGGAGRDRRPPPTHDRPHVKDKIHKYEQEAERAMRATENYQPGPVMRKELHKSMHRPDDTDTVVTETTDIDVQLLNHCFDDIERFVGRLQQAADAFKELDRRRQGRSDRRGDRRDYRHGDGMLTMRSRPPPAKDFIEVFQKFKLSFNLLAKLKTHIHDPNAPELVHFLFTPLSLVVEASKDPRHGTPDLASKVVSPLLSAEAVELLRYCLTSKEADLWMSLGDSWSIHRDQWKGYVPPYNPRFADGWQPEPGWLEDNEPHSTMGRSNRPKSINDGYQRNYNRYDNSRDYSRDIPQHSPQDRGMSYDDRPPSDQGSSGLGSPYGPDHQERSRQVQELAERAQRERDERDRRWADEMNRRDDYRGNGSRPTQNSQTLYDRNLAPEQQEFLSKLRSRGSKIYQATHDRTGRNNKELTIDKGEILEVLDDSRNWWKLQNSKGQEGHAPYTILTPYKSGDGQKQRRLGHSERHYIPNPQHNFSCARSVYNSPPVHNSLATTISISDNKPIQIISPSVVKQSSLIKGVRSNRNELHNELIKTIHNKQNTASSPKVIQKPIVKSPNISNVAFINHKSNSKDVQYWLKSKAFSHKVQTTLYGQTGSQLFKLKKSQLEQIFGHEEGSRLFSQLTVQKNLAGYTTGRSAELQAILKHRREKADESGENLQESYIGDISIQTFSRYRTDGAYYSGQSDFIGGANSEK